MNTLSTEERRTLAPDLLLDTALTWDKYKMMFAVAALVLVVGLVSWGLYENHRAQVTAAAAAAFTSAKTDAAYRKVIADYPGTEAAANAYLLLGRTKFDAKDYAGAMQAWKEFSDKYPHHVLVPEALIGQATALESEGKLDEARAMYQRVATSYQSSYAAPLARLSEGSLLLSQRKIDEAKHAFEDVIASDSRSDVGRSAEQSLKLLNVLPPPGATPLPKLSTPTPVFPGVSALPAASPVTGASASPAAAAAGSSPEIPAATPTTPSPVNRPPPPGP